MIKHQAFEHREYKGKELHRRIIVEERIGEAYSVVILKKRGRCIL